MATAPPLPGTLDYLHRFVQECTVTGVSQLKGPRAGVRVESNLTNISRVPVMFRVVLPQINESRHALLFLRPEISPIDLDHAIYFAFNIDNWIAGKLGMITGYRPVWAPGHTPPVGAVDNFETWATTMGQAHNGIIEVDATQMACKHCEEKDGSKLQRCFHTERGIQWICSACVEQYTSVAYMF